MSRKAKCLYCGKPSTLLCDFTMGFKGEPGATARLSTLETYRCDAPLCGDCARHMGVMFWHGGGAGGVETIDYCPGHPSDGNRWLQRPMNAAEAHRLRYRHRRQAGLGLRLVRGGGQLSLFIGGTEQ